MNTPKSTVEEIRTRFDADVERFSNLETGPARCSGSVIYCSVSVFPVWTFSIKMAPLPPLVR
jgi:hypothetical protein